MLKSLHVNSELPQGHGNFSQNLASCCKFVIFEHHHSAQYDNNKCKSSMAAKTRSSATTEIACNAHVGAHSLSL